jgi:RHS repeat-associated protein
VASAREFRYDNAMQRYMNIELDPADDFEPIETVWTDYDGDRVYGDYEVVNSALADTVSHEPGIGFVDDPTGTPVRGYYHGDMLGTTRRTTNASAAQVDNAAYTAFGEFLGGSADRRYGFAGAWQYQSHPGTGFPYLHVGHRYYDPATGRFLQRDPIGIDGGFNVYAYVRSLPTIALDPTGLAAPPGAGAAVEGGDAMYGGAKGIAGAAENWRNDARRRHFIEKHPGVAQSCAAICATCRELDRADRRRDARRRNEDIYPRFSWFFPWNWGFNRWYE